jgi:antitoxin StbD
VNQMFQKLDADIGVSVTDLKKNPAGVVRAAELQPVAILNHNKVVAYVISPAAWEYAQELHDDAKTVEMIEARKGETPIPVSLDEL